MPEAGGRDKGKLPGGAVRLRNSEFGMKKQVSGVGWESAFIGGFILPLRPFASSAVKREGRGSQEGRGSHLHISQSAFVRSWPSHTFRPHHIDPAYAGPQLSFVVKAPGVCLWGLLCQTRAGQARALGFLIYDL